MPPNNHRHPEMDYGSEGNSDLEVDLEEQDTIWSISYPRKPIANSSQRTKKRWEEAQVHDSNFHGKGQSKEALNLRYVVEPGTWLGLQNYRKCTGE